MEFVPIVIVGIVATAYMTAVNLGAERFRVVRGSMLHAIGAFVIPEPVRRPLLTVGLHFLAGIAFTAVYAYVFAFLRPASVPDYVSVGVLIGLVHGFFVSYFMMLGFSALQQGDMVRPFTFSAAGLNVFAHIVFGAAVGLGLGYAALTGTALWFSVYSASGLIAVVGLGAFLIPPLRRFRLPAEPATGRAP